MELAVKFDFSDFLKKADELKAASDQVPYALSRAINQAGEDAQNVLIQQTWPRSVKVRNPSFMRAALRRVPSTKHNLTFEIVDVLHRGSLKKHAIGGSKTAKSRFAIPVERNTPRGSHGVPQSQRPRALGRKGAFVIGNAIYTKVGKRLKLRYILKRSIFQPKDVAFYEDFEISMRNGVRTAFPLWLKRAMQTRRIR